MFKVNFPQGNLFTGIYLSVPFRDGEGVTENAYLADRFRAKGMAVESQCLEKKPDIGKPIGKMTVPELEANAAEMGADISDCKNRAEKVAKLLELLEKNAQEEEPPADDNEDDLPPDPEADPAG